MDMLGDGGCLPVSRPRADLSLLRGPVEEERRGMKVTHLVLIFVAILTVVVAYLAGSGGGGSETAAARQDAPGVQQGTDAFSSITGSPPR
jgi:hypothetical protein